MNKQTLKAIIFAGLFAVPLIPFLVSSSFFFPFITTKAFAWRIIVEVIFAAWVLLALLDENYRPRKSFMLYALLFFLGVVGLSTLFSVDIAKSFWSNFERMEGYISLLHLGAFFVVISSVFREVDWKRWWNTSLAASALMVVYALFQLAGVIVIRQGGARVDGTFGNATYLAVYMLIHIFITALFLYRSRKDSTMRWVYTLLILGQVVTLYYTATRGAILGLLGGLLIVALLNIRNKEDKTIRKLSAGSLAAIMLLAGGFWLMKDTNFVRESPVLSRFSSISATELQSGGRSFVWPMAIEGFKERPIFGWGQENFVYVFQKYYQAEMYRLEPWFDRAHNTYLDWLVAAGLLGVLGYLSLYIITLYLIWRTDNNFSHVEKSIITGLLAAYAFHNLFVFDHLISYILFFSLLAYVQSREENILAKNIRLPELWVKSVALPAIAILFLLQFYFWNVKPLIANIYLIEALKSIQLQEFESAGDYLAKAYGASAAGRPEIVQHTANNAIFILTSGIPLQKKNEFYAFAKSAVLKEVENHPNEAKVELLAGSFLSATGLHDESLMHLEKAKSLMPAKQLVYFELGALYINMNERLKALEVFKTAYDLAPGYQEAKIIYLIGAIYAGDRVLENKLITELSKETIASDARIRSAYSVVGR